jgi:hypothetical protein
LWNWIFVLPPFVAVGGLVAYSTLDLEYGSGALHYSFYLVVAVILHRLTTGSSGHWIWNIGQG